MEERGHDQPKAQEESGGQDSSHTSDSCTGTASEVCPQPDVSSPSPSVTSPVKYFKDNGHLVIHSENTDFAEAAEEGCKRSFMPWSKKR